MPAADGRGLAVGVDVRHHIVAHLALALLGHGVVDVGDVRFQLRDLPGGDGQPQLVLRAGERHPEPDATSESAYPAENRCSIYGDA